MLLFPIIPTTPPRDYHLLCKNMKLLPGLILIWIFRKNHNSIFGRKISSHQKVCDQREWFLDEGCLIKKCLISGALTQTFVLSIFFVLDKELWLSSKSESICHLSLRGIKNKIVFWKKFLEVCRGLEMRLHFPTSQTRNVQKINPKQV